MGSTSWILVALISTILAQVNADPKAKINNRFQLVVHQSSDNYTITLDGSPTTGADIYGWRVVKKPKHAAHPTFVGKDHPITNVTIDSHKGEYHFRLRARARLHDERREYSDAFSKVYVERPDSVGMHLFATTIVNRLLTMQYQYIALSQFHLRAQHYHPKVAEYFRKHAEDRGEMLHEVTQHVLAKQATEDLINSCPTDYVTVMMSEGFKHQIDFDVNATDFIASSFETAQQAEAELAIEMAIVVHHADRNGDYELSEFVAADLLPRVTKVMNGHKNHLETTLRPVNNSPAYQRHLVEFLFDKYLKI